ncbi:HD domain-containing protein [Heliorestis acidaminivorans]|uniref:HD domain-containing protein n=1 Tax=Heliorestis acidaminivorans TaxID=553427 RepID=A0A6I0EV84_9FIRM|nr:HD domain-containing phosphohydrolase [Heliorestis acidaminivorans]KAB2951789.1 HD domain-containing protein [Heliorestis acidaminivorans]
MIKGKRKSPQWRRSLTEGIMLNHLMEGLSLAGDLAEGKPTEHAKNMAFIASSIGTAMDLPKTEIRLLYYAGLLHNILCDDCDHHRIRKIQEEEEGEDVVLPLLMEVEEIVMLAHENWDGSGPLGRQGTEIPLLARILAVAMIMTEAWDTSRDYLTWRPNIERYIEKYKGIIFDPTIVKTAKNLLKDYRFTLDISRVVELDRWKALFETEQRIYGDSLRIVGVLFAHFIDQKGIGTANHSRDVAVVAKKLARNFELGPEKEEEIYIAGLLHDLGKVVVPKEILEKEGPLTKEERIIIERHPYYTALILDRIPELSSISRWAASHHERLDGSGYFMGATAKELSLEARIIAVSDVYAALASKRSYRNAMDRSMIINILQSEAMQNKLDKEIVEALVVNFDKYKRLLAITYSAESPSLYM